MQSRCWKINAGPISPKELFAWSYLIEDQWRAELLEIAAVISQINQHKMKTFSCLENLECTDWKASFDQSSSSKYDYQIKQPMSSDVIIWFDWTVLATYNFVFIWSTRTSMFVAKAVAYPAPMLCPPPSLAVQTQSYRFNVSQDRGLL